MTPNRTRIGEETDEETEKFPYLRKSLKDTKQRMAQGKQAFDQKQEIIVHKKLLIFITF